LRLVLNLSASTVASTHEQAEQIRDTDFVTLPRTSRLVRRAATI